MFIAVITINGGPGCVPCQLWMRSRLRACGAVEDPSGVTPRGAGGVSPLPLGDLNVRATAKVRGPTSVVGAGFGPPPPWHFLIILVLMIIIITMIIVIIIILIMIIIMIMI